MEGHQRMLSKSSLKLVFAIGSVVVVAAALSADRPQAFKPTEKAFYLDQTQLNFIRPGLVFTITKAEIAADGTVKAYLKVTDPKGAGLDRLGVVTPGAVSISFLLGYIPADGSQYTSYITRTRTGAAGTVTQATGENTGTWTVVNTGEYIYTFTNKLPSGYDKNATHTIGVYGSRNLDEFEMGRQYADTTFNFVPAGGAVTKVRDVIRTASCNKCHDQLGLHGGSRRSVEVCNMCHTPQTPDSATGNITDMKVFIHKIHFGANLPSVKAGKPYKVANADYSDVVNPSPAMACKACHEDKSVTGATQADNWNTKPSIAACGSCHDDVNFATGAGHVGLPQFNDNQCANCHQPKGEVDFDASIMGAHTVPVNSSLLAGVVFSIQKADDVLPGKRPTVTFTVKDKKGNPVDISTLNSLRLYMGGPTSDVSSYVREDVLKATGPGDGRYFWTFAASIPATAKGSYQFGIEGYRTTVVLKGTQKERSIRDYGINAVFSASLDSTPVVPRRASVATASCNKCHYSIEFHGGNRNTVEQCTFCHNPNLTAGTAKESFNFANMIHRFHEEARYPGNLRNCSQCHVNNSQFPVVRAGSLPVVDGLAPISPVPANTNACMVCHNTPEAWSHAQANTTALGESCTVCHGSAAEFSVSKVHAQ
jgi:OmcA/MtrC family decaheme c-type cytochrome